MTAWSISWRMDIVFGSKNTIWTLVKFEIDGWAWQLSMIRAIFNHLHKTFSWVYWPTLQRSHYSSNSPFVICTHRIDAWHSWSSGILDFQITNMGSFSPVALAAAIPVSLTLLFFPRNTFLLWGDMFYLGDIDRKDRTRRHWKYLPTYSLKELLVRLFRSKSWSSLL